MKIAFLQISINYIKSAYAIYSDFYNDFGFMSPFLSVSGVLNGAFSLNI